MELTTAPPKRPRLADRAQPNPGGTNGAAEVWTKISALGKQTDMIDMGQGFPDFAGSTIARMAAAEAMSGVAVAPNTYSPIYGAVALRSAIASFYMRRYQIRYDPETEIFIACGAQEALFAALLVAVNPGEEVVVFEPCYPFLLPMVRMTGAKPRVITLKSPSFSILDVEKELRDAFDKGHPVSAVVFNSPHNPTGHVASAPELELIASLCYASNAIAIADEVYEMNVYEGATHKRLCEVTGSNDAGNWSMRERTISISSASKVLSLTGWRVGWASGPADLIAAIVKAHSAMTYCAPTPLQLGVARGLEEDDIGDVKFQENADALSEALLSIGCKPCPVQGGYFLVADCSPAQDGDFAMKLAQAAKVVATPMSVFYATEGPCSLVRFAICKTRAHVERACSAIEKLGPDFVREVASCRGEPAKNA